ncbi:ImpA family metalloprotease [Shewanella algae]|uniref:ImpA family metalloprotease n=1 Tax=Shewanella algae TaxID=38313 RepID=UPI0031F4CAD3
MARKKPLLLHSILLGSLLLGACGGGDDESGAGSSDDNLQPPAGVNQAPKGDDIQLAYDSSLQSIAVNWQGYVSDPDGDPLQASIAEQGKLGQFSLDGDMLSYKADKDAKGSDQGLLQVSDGRGGSVNLKLAVFGVDSQSPLERALASGDASGLDPDTLLEAIAAQITQLRSNEQALRQRVFADTALAYAPGNRTQLFNIIEPEMATPLLRANTGQVLAVTGEQHTGRFAAFGTHLFARFHAGELTAMEPANDNLLAWLLNRAQAAELQQPLTVSLSFLGGQESASRSWLQGRFPNWTIKSCNQVATLEACITDAQLLISGWRAADTDAGQIAGVYSRALASGKALYYQHNWYEATNAVADAIAGTMGVSLPYGGNFWANAAADWSSATAMAAAFPLLGGEQRLTQHLIDDDFNFDWSGCETYVGKVSCDKVNGFESEFLTGARALKNSLNQLDSRGQVLFGNEGRRLLKLFVLLGDLYRTDIAYPMDKDTTPQGRFLAAYLADHLALYLRGNNPAQPDLGNFSDPLPQTLTLENVSLEMALGKESGYRGSGFYLLPGQSVRLERKDTLPLTVKAFINTQRTGSTREFNNQGYQRPKFLRSVELTLKPGQPLTLSSPYGGTLMLQLPAGEGVVSVEAQNVLAYPYLKDFNQASGYLTALETSPLSWAGLRTDFVEINSRKHMMKQFIYAEPYRGDVEQALNDVWRYMIKGTYDLAGFSGEGLTLAPSVAARCALLGWDCQNEQIHAKPKVQHINVDEAAHCGGGCSGNPYDQAWVLSPFGWGESHEIGHNLQRNRLKIYGGRSGEVSNNIFPLYKGWQRFKDSGERIASCDRQSPQTTFEWLKQAQNSSDPVTSVYDKLWSQTGTYDNAGPRLDFYLQLAALAEEHAGLDNGWQIFTLLYLHERLFSHAIADAARWGEMRDALGMSSYIDAPNLDGNDFMLLSLSKLLQLDMRPWFDLWGVRYQAQAANQVAAYGYPAAEAVFYRLSSQCAELAVPKLTLDANW